MVKFKPSNNRNVPTESMVVGGSPPEPVQKQPKPKMMKGSDIGPEGQRSLAIRKRKKIMLVAGPILIVLTLTGVAGAWYLHKHNQSQQPVVTVPKPPTDLPIDDELAQANAALSQGKPAEALVHAKKSLASTPNDVEAITNVASIAIKAGDTAEAKKLYSQALEEFKKQDNPDVDGQPALTYWAAGNLAEEAGINDQAIKYYKKALAVADSSNIDDQNVINKAKPALARLQ